MKLSGTVNWVVLCGLALVTTAGCSDEPKCGESGELCGSGASGSGGASGGNGGAGGSEGGQGGSGGGPIPGCEDSPAENPQVISDSCGVFVSAKAEAGGNGTKGKPFKTIGEGIAAAGSKRVLVCGEQTFAEAVTLDGTELYGGFDCSAEWAYLGQDATKRSIIEPTESGAIALRTTGDVVVAGLKVVAPSGSEPGQSSIAALVDGGSGAFTDVDLVAQAAADGAPGETPAGTGAPGEEGTEGTDESCTTAGVLGGSGAEKLCGVTDVSGGPGGNGTNGTVGGEGGDGQGLPQAAPNDGEGGLGEAVGACVSGNTGGAGQPGPAGAGAEGIGSLSSSGFSSVAGGDGQGSGTPGQGGGGGGGAKECMSDGTKAGPSGGGGGSGGCGGAAGKGGRGGGASIGLVSLDASVALTRVHVTTAKGGVGGVGGDGQVGGNGGQPGASGGSGACVGGTGGKGGRGGSGGGGVGGHSLAIAFSGEPPAETELSVDLGDAGEGGLGGDEDPAASLVGAPGKQCRALNFDRGTCAG